MDNQQPTPQRNRLHPLVATAAGAVIVASLAATAAITGVFPKANSNAEQNPQTQAAMIASQPAVDTTAAAARVQQEQAARRRAEERSAQERRATAARHPAAAPQQQPQYAQQQPQQPQQAYCQTCGTVVAVVPVHTPGQSTGIGAVGGAAAGGLVGNQFGHGNGRTAMTILGALGGGLAGNSIEKQVRSETDYQVQVRMENGSTRTFTYRSAPPFGQGQRVRIENGTLVAA